jgi:hypothetical protein
MQLRSFSELWNMSAHHPDSGIKRITLDDIFDDDRSEENIWWKNFMPEVSITLMLSQFSIFQITKY